MFKHTFLSVAMAALLGYSSVTLAASDADLQAIRNEIAQLKQGYEQRIAELEQRVERAENAAKSGVSTASQGSQEARPASLSGSSDNSFNPAVALILSGTYATLQRADSPATGFAMSPNNTGYTRGMSLKESELGLSANIDAQYRGVATLALAPAGGVTVENAFVQGSANGLGMKLGRFFSGLGYLNEQHAHAWDFVDQPLAYRALWDNQLGEDGVQLKWLAPTDTFVELGAEMARGRGFPASDRNKNGIGSGVLFAHLGDDIGIEQSWRAGLSLHQTRRENATSNNVPDALNTVGGVSNGFSGNSRTVGLDGVWKYAPNGNTRGNTFKLQGEYFRRSESGVLTYDTAGANLADAYAVNQSAWYLQGVYQFQPSWRVGVRYDQLDSGNASIGAGLVGKIITNYGYQPTRWSTMLDYSPSEFARFRVQLNRDATRQGLIDHQLFLQYVMSLGAHGAHSY
jgi:hypothetical protein